MKKISNLAITLANQRLAGMKSIDPELDLGNGLTILSYQTAVSETEALVSMYNSHKATLGEIRNQLAEKQKALNDLSERMLIGVGAKFGKNSNQYQKAGGTKKSLRKKPRKAVPKTNEAA